MSTSLDDAQALLPRETPVRLIDQNGAAFADDTYALPAAERLATLIADVAARHRPHKVIGIAEPL